MKLPAVFSVAALAQVSLADFYLFRVEAGGDSGWQISDNPTPDCREMGPHTPWYGAKLVVPGQTLGVTCNGAGCWGNGVCYFQSIASKQNTNSLVRIQRQFKM